jgi:hypothetical protein
MHREIVFDSAIEIALTTTFKGVATRAQTKELECKKYRTDNDTEHS